MNEEFKLIFDLATKGNLEESIRQFERFKAVIQDADEAERKRQETFGKSKSEVEAIAKVEKETSEARKKAATDQEGIINRQKQQLAQLRVELGKTTDPKQLEKYASSIEEVNLKMKETRDNAKLLAQQNKAVAGSYNALILRNKQLANELKNSPMDRSTREIEAMKREYNANTQALKRFDKELGVNYRNVGNYEEAIKNAAQGLQGFGQGLLSGAQGGGGGLGAIAGGIGGLAGAVPALAAVAGGVELISSMAGDVQILNNRLRDTAAITGLTGKALTNLVADVKTVSDVWQQDYNETLRATNVLMETFGLDGAEAVDKINEAFLRGGDINGDLLDQLSEYSTQFEAAGLSAEHLVNVIAQSADKGIFSDKAPDTIKEGTIRIREMTTATRDALRGIGLDSDKIQRELRNNQTTIADVIAQVGDKLAELPPQSTQVGAAMADIFGATLEDAGLGFVEVLQNVNKALDESKTPLSEYAQRQQEIFETERELNRVTTELGEAFTGFSSTLTNVTNVALLKLYETLTSVFQSFEDNTDIVGRFVAKINQMQSISSLERELKALEEQSKNTGTQFSDYIKTILGVGGTTPELEAAKRTAVLESKIAALRKRIVELKEESAEDIPAPVILTDEQIKQLDNFRKYVDANRDNLTPLSAAEVAKLEAAIKKARDEFTKLLEEEKKAFANIATLDPGTELNEKGKQAKETLEVLAKAWQAAFGEEFLTDQEEGIKSFMDKYDERIKKHAEDFEEAEKQKTEAMERETEIRRQLVDAGIVAFADLINASFDISAGNRDRELEDLQTVYDRRLQLAGDNADARARIEEEYARKELAIRRKQASADKAQAIFSAIINQALAVTRTIANLGLPAAIPFIALTTVTTGAQIAAIASQPLPQFFKGTQDSPEGWAMLGERGRELVQTPKGNLYMTNDGPQLGYLDRHSKVFTNPETERIMNFVNNTHNTQVKGFDSSALKWHDEKQTQAIASAIIKANTLDEKLLAKLIAEAMKKVPFPLKGFTDHNIRNYIQKGNSRITDLNAQNSWDS